MRIIDPSSDQIIDDVPEDSAPSIGDKLLRARAAQPTWARRPLEERQSAIRRFRKLIEERTPQLAETLTVEMGKPISQSRAELRGLLDRIDFFVNHVEAELADEVVHRAADLEERIRHEPLGVIANISAWNYPYFVGANVFLPALLTGNAVLYKPSEYATLTGLAIGELLWESGVPRDVFAVVVGAAEIGAALCEASIDGMFFTGSYRTGQRIARAVAPRMVRLQLELGGKDPVYVADDVDVDAAAPRVADGAFYNTGQSCCAVERVYVHDRIWPAFVDKFVATVRGFRVGDPRDEATYIGPLARRDAQLALLADQVADARDKGAEIRVGGGRIERPGYYFEPTVVVDVDHSMRLMTEESFGPVIGLMRVGSDEEARERMNDTTYGLTASVYSADRARAEAVLSRLAVGSAYWNCCDRVSPRLPWSGRRDSGIGCTLSTYGIQAFLAPKAWHLRL